ncbi:MAG TPA: protein kinase [Vicinamibacterales bacterium]|nr:protein kinase [Vicinamibacterales bacterium]
MIGRTIGPYECVAKLGEGGMGEVYRARDTRLNRDVALKVLPAGVAAAPDRLARFRREAQVLAALNHPNIGQIYGFEEGSTAGASGPSEAVTRALVLELIEGPTLAERLAHGPLAPREALAIARQIALALEVAHAHGIVHRDLKPANIKVQDNGAVKVLDFGLAKALEPAGGSSPDSENSPTLTNRATMTGVILGTAAYMAPEQARGKTVDKRADVWSFGVVLYEMLAGRRLFRGADVTDTIAEVLKTDPDWSALPASTPASIRTLLRRCLERDRDKRLHDIADARLEIEDAASGPAAAPEPAVRPSIGRERWLWALATAALVVALLTTIASRRSADAPQPELRVEVVTPPFFTPGAPAFALSPDGQTIAYLAITGGKSRIWIRQLSRDDAHAIDGTEGALSVNWPGDGRSVLFVRGGVMQEVDVGGGAPRARQDLPGGGFGASWNSAGVVLHAPANAAPISRLSSGSAPVPATRLVPPQVGHRFPLFLPDGRHFLYLAAGPPDVQGLYLGSLDSLDAKRVVVADTAPSFLPPYWIVFGLADTLYAQRVDLARWEPIGKPVFIADQVLQVRNVFGAVAVATSASGVLAYRKAVLPPHQLTWLDRSGRTISTIGDIDTAELVLAASPRLSPDGRTIALVRRLSGQTSIWTIENQAHGVMQRFTSNQNNALYPVWTPDGTRIAFQSSRRGGGFYDLFVKSFGADGAESPLMESADNKTMNDWSRDNRFALVTVQFHQEVQRDIWALPVAGDDRKPFAVSADPADEIAGRFSPDAHWIAFQSNDGTGPEIYVRPFPGPGRAFRISSEGGAAPEWGRDGREVFYLSRDNHLMAVPVTLLANGMVERGAPATLFALRAGSSYSVGPDGRFLVNLVLEDAPTPPINLIFNWAGLRQ